MVFFIFFSFLLNIYTFCNLVGSKRTTVRTGLYLFTQLQSGGGDNPKDNMPSLLRIPTQKFRTIAATPSTARRH